VLQALLHGKLSRTQENLEDILTSNVFGVLHYVEPVKGLLPLLGDAKSPDGVPNPLLSLGRVTKSHLECWPALRWRGGVCEPDVLLRLNSEGRQRWLIAVEVKYRSGKSASGESLDAVHFTDQLAKEWDALRDLGDQEGRTPMLIYLTADYGLPRHVLAESAADYQRFAGEGGEFRCFWLSWHRLPAIVEESALGAIGRDLLALADRLGFGYFGGFSAVPGVRLNWRFNRIKRTTFDFRGLPAGSAGAGAAWQFKRTKKTAFHFTVQTRTPIDWRFSYGCG
jgi:hypothetical protein